MTCLSDPSRALSFQDDGGRYRLTVLGLHATRSILPLSMAAGLGQLLRDLLSIDASDDLLGQWQPLDHLIVLELLRDRVAKLRPFSKDLADQVDAWMEAVPGRSSMLYRTWLAGDAGSGAAEVLGSLGISRNGVGATGDQVARKTAYSALFRAVVIYDRGLGTPADELERRWKMTGLDGVEERWRDELLWLLSGVAGVLHVRSFFFHLREECSAHRERIRRVKRQLGRMRAQTIGLRQQLKYCSPLGPLLRSMQQTEIAGDGPKVGIQTIRHLEGAGICSLAQLAGMELVDLVRLGVRRDLAKQLHTYLRRRLQ